MAYEQLESLWPVHGSVLIHDDVVWCVAGRSNFLDGGLRMLRLDLASGRKLSETILDETESRHRKEYSREAANPANARRPARHSLV